LRLVDEDEERPMRLAEAETETEEDGGTLEDFRGEMEPWTVAVGFMRL